MSLILAFVLNTAVATPPATPEVKNVETKATEGAKAGATADCDGKDKKVQALSADPKAAEQKAAEEKALTNLGLKKDEPKAKADPVVTSSPGMETCKY